MGKRGPAPTPTKTLKLRGSARGAKRKAEPVAPPGVPAMPSELAADGRGEWERITGLLDGMGMMASTDLAALSVYCMAWESLLMATRIVNEDGYMVIGERGQGLPHPMLVTRSKAMDQLNRSAAKLGLSPADRAGLSVPKVNSTKAKGRFFKTETG